MSRVEIKTDYPFKDQCRLVTIVSASEVDKFHVDAEELAAASQAGATALLAFVYDNSTGHILRDAAKRGTHVHLDGVPVEGGLLSEAMLEGVDRRY